MKLLVSFMPFKNFMSSTELNNLFSDLYKHKFNQITKIPFSDGGEGLSEIFLNSHSVVHTIKIKDCFNRSNKTQVLINKKEKFGLIEIYKTMGQIRKNDFDPLKRSSYGVGQCISYLLRLNINKIFIGTGGSINTDCGIGMAHALGVKFYDTKDNILNKKNIFFHSKYINKIHKINFQNFKKKFKKVKFFIISDSSVKLCGRNGQVNIFSKQKKINHHDQFFLKRGFERMKKIFKMHSRKNFDLPYLGSGGGVTSMIYFLFNSKLLNGSSFISKKQKIKEHIKKHDLIVSGEGKIDLTTFKGKGLSEIISLAKLYKKKLFLIVGQNSVKNSNNLNLINLNFKKIPSKTNFVAKFQKQINFSQILNEKTNK